MLCVMFYLISVPSLSPIPCLSFRFCCAQFELLPPLPPIFKPDLSSHSAPVASHSLIQQTPPPPPHRYTGALGVLLLTPPPPVNRWILLLLTLLFFYYNLYLIYIHTLFY